VPRLIHLNGPPAVGKSTIAELYVADHPGTLLLDIDRLRMMVGGWQEDFVGVGEVVRPLAQAMAQAHLAGERDVVMPQYLGDLREIEGFEHVATAAGAEFVEVVLMAEGESIVHRFAERGSGSDDQLLHVITSTVGRSGGPAYLRALHDQLSDAVASRERAIVVQSRQGDIEGTYRDVLAGLGGAEP
jgi:predicted kinase